MNNEKKFLKKMCNFYANEIHLSTMILPFISKKINEEAIIETFLEKPIIEDVQILVSKLNLKEDTQRKINDINWNITNICNKEKFDYYMNNLINKGNEIYFIINGKNEYINLANKLIEEWTNKNSKILLENNKNVNIINCYEITQVNWDINDILEKHDNILNTSGVRKIEEVFDIKKNCIS